MCCIVDSELILKTVVAVTAVGGFLFGIYQYTKAQHWKRAEFAAKELERLSTDPVLSLACIFLDYDERTVNVPEIYKEMAKSNSFIHRWAILEKAMMASLTTNDGRNGFTWLEVLYRDVFDHFFTYLVSIDHYIDIDLVSKRDISILKYWLEKLSHPPFADRRPIFDGYIKYFSYYGVDKLIVRFGINS